jgi:hypothetical protein
MEIENQANAIHSFVHPTKEKQFNLSTEHSS